MEEKKKAENIKNIMLTFSLWLGISVIIDYLCTLHFSGSVENLINNEYSLLLIYAVKHEILIPYGLFMMVLYFSCAYLALDALRNQKVFPIAALSIALIAISHTFGGLSWYVRSTLYSNMVLPMIAFGLMIFCFAHLLMWKTPAPAPSSS